MNALSEILRDTIRRNGPIPFDVFMETALYHPELGYYRTARDPFGKHGDFFTASQIQPVYGMLISSLISEWMEGWENPAVLELGGGRQEMKPAFASFSYSCLEIHNSALPEKFRGVLFANEFFDALPVRCGVIRNGTPKELCVEWNGERFCWRDGDCFSAAEIHYLHHYYSPLQEGSRFEISKRTMEWMSRLGGTLDNGWLLAIDYGFTKQESVGFPEGTLMSYRRHSALPDVLQHPGLQDITAHVNFTALQAAGIANGFSVEHFQPLSRTLLRAVERNPEVFQKAAYREQLKTLLYGFGESFRTVLFRKGGPENKKGPETGAL